MFEKLEKIISRMRPNINKTESEIEKKLFFALRRFGLNPTLQYVAHGIRCDMAFPEKKIAIECDVKEFHKDKLRDQSRDRILEDRGWIVLRYSGSDIYNNSNAISYAIINEHFSELLESEVCVNFLKKYQSKNTI